MKRKLNQDYSTFNVISFLDEYGVSYKTSGKNIANGWVGVESCPFCTGGGFHFGINLSSNKGSCWICGEAGMAPKIVQVLAECEWKEAYEIIQRYSSDTVNWIPEPDSTGKTVIFPDGLSKVLNKQSKQYLKTRKYSPEEIQNQFKIQCTSTYSTLYVEDREWNFSERIIIPVFMNRVLQCYIGRDYTGEAESKYMNSPVVASIIEPHSCIYNYDTLRKKVIFLEGPTDVWRFGAKTGAFVGKTFTKKQIQSLIYRDIDEATVLFDKNADKAAYKLANALTSVIDKVKVAFITEDDPGVMEQDEAYKTKYQLIGEI